MKLIIVESPTKALTISQFLGKDFIIESCNGHVRDLPKSRLGIEIERDFTPQYIIPVKKKKIVNQLKKKASQAKEIYFATDEDREGEAIAWHLKIIFDEVLKKETKCQRIAFHEITKEAVLEAIKNPRQIDLNLVEAQQARRILDRLVGYSLSPLLWRKIARRLSAGRVQSVALRLIVERERERESFIPQEYYTIFAVLRKLKILKPQSQIPNEFKAKLYKIGKKKLDKFTIKTKKEAEEIVKNLKDAIYLVNEIREKEISKPPLPPFTTSTLQQVANRRFGYSTKKTMMVAQQLYEGVKLGQEGLVGLITYIRTDSFNLSEKFLKETRNYLQKNFDTTYKPPTFRFYQTKRKIAQEAHEAIRPTSIYRQPDQIKNYLTKEQFKIYDLIWRRSLACQMAEARIKTMTIDVLAKKKSIANHYFKATGSQIKFAGWLDVYPIKIDEVILPDVNKDEKLDLLNLESNQHFTEPPARYSEAGLVKVLEKYGIGRPSTYAPIISTLFERNYLQKENGRLIPTEIGCRVNDLLVKHFPKIVDYQFTATMEERLDKIAEGKEKWQKMISDFYWPFKKELEEKEKEIVQQKPIDEKTDQVCEKCGRLMLVKFSRFGKFLACSGFPECKFTKSLQPINDGNDLIECPKCGEGQVVKKRTKKGRFFYTCSKWPECDFASWQSPKDKNDE
ncbi:MAG: type I DNA topoisomerase [Patescibacteria group bacterium]|nr:type I DNA topoisomerase [Patescibacteria group bacterium]